MKLSISLVNLFLSPVAMGIARQRARARKHVDFFYQDIAIYCAPEQENMVKESIDAVIDFFGDQWVQYRKNIKCIVFDNELETILWVARKSIIIREGDQRRMASVQQLAASIIHDCERIQAYQESRCLKIIWKSEIIATSKIRAESKRAEYLSQE